MNWKHLVAACFIVCAALVRFGAPLAPVLVGVCGVFLFSVLRARRAH